MLKEKVPKAPNTSSFLYELTTVVDFKVVTRDNYESFLLLASNFVYNLPRQKAAAASTMPTRLKYALHLHFYNLLTISDVTDFKETFLSFHPHLIAIGAL